MNTLELKSIRELVLRSNEKIYQGENKIVSFDVVLPEKIGDYATAECNIEMRCYLGDNYIPFEISTASRKTSTKVTSDITETAQTVQILFYITHGDDVIGKTNKVDLIVYETKAGTPIDPRSELDEIIRQQRATIAEQENTISDQQEVIQANESAISGLNTQVSELTTENTRLENLTETQRETIQNMLDNPPAPKLYTPPVVTPNGQVQQITAPQDYDGLESVVVDRIPGGERVFQIDTDSQRPIVFGMDSHGWYASDDLDDKRELYVGREINGNFYIKN